MTATGPAPSPDTRVFWTLKPSLLSILARPLIWLCVITLLSAALLALLQLGGADISLTHKVLLWTACVIVARLVFEVVAWNCTSFTLSSTSIITRRGVFRRSAVEIPLSRIQHLELFRGIRERLIGAGTIGIGTGAGVEAVLDSVGDPQLVLDSIRAVMNLQVNARVRPPVLGLVGSIGAGKSTLATAFKARGCLVLDSDSAAKEALKRPDVIATIVRWWGQELLDSSGQIDRSRLAAIVFSDPAKRKQLEGLTHPILKVDRAAAITQASNVPAIIIDAPLLFEAGVDAECDAVICVDAPREARVERVKSRGWSEADLARREAAQLPIDEKRRRSRWVIDNSGSAQSLHSHAESILAQLSDLTLKH